MCGDACERTDPHATGCTCEPCRVIDSKPRGEFDWIQMRSGIAFDPVHPVWQDVRIGDIAHALSNQCRFTGHTEEHYSTGQHSILIALTLPKELALRGLLHDAGEAYCVDVAKPLKRQESFAAYRQFEKRCMHAVCKAFHMPSVEPAEVKLADDRMLATELLHVMGPSQRKRKPGEEPFEMKITPWEPKKTKALFLALANELKPAGAGSMPGWRPSR